MTATSLEADLRVPFPTEREAEIAYNSLRVDKEPKRAAVTRNMQVEGNYLNVHWVAIEARAIRVSMNSFLDHLSLVIETLDKFGPPQS